jgi:hypothetical protein
MADEHGSGKWAAEVYDFIRLFQRDGKRFLGLLFLELGWLLFIILLAKLSSSEHPPYVFEFAVPALKGAAGKLLTFRATTLYSAGALIVFLFWIAYSRLYLFVLSPLLRIVRIAIIALFVVASLFLGLAESIVAALAKLWARVAKKKYVEPKYLEVFSRLQRRVWIELFSSGRVDIAPIVAYSYEEDFRAAKLPLQIFGSAAEQCRIRLEPIGFGRFLHFEFLPVSARVYNASKARWIRRLFGGDVLLWGSFSGDDLWINFERKSPGRRRSNHSTTEKIKVRYTPAQQLIFGDELTIDFPVAAVPSSEARGAYITLAIATLDAVVNRRKLPGVFSILDQLYLYNQDISALTLKLLMDVFFELPDRALKASIPPSADEVLALLMGRWARAQLRSDILADIDEKKNLVNIAYMVERRCARLLPRNSDELYGLGAFAFYLGRVEEAADMLKTAGRVDQDAHGSNPIMAGVYAGMELLEAEGTREQEYALPRFAAYATRAIYTGGEFARKSLREDMDKSYLVILHKNGTRKHPEIEFVEALMAEDSSNPVAEGAA